MYIWDRQTAELLAAIECDCVSSVSACLVTQPANVVNCLVQHPTQPMMAASGIDYTVKMYRSVHGATLTSAVWSRPALCGVTWLPLPTVGRPPAQS